MSKPSMIDFFCGIGSASAGFKNAGFKIAGALDIDTKACENYARNLGFEAINCDINRITGKQVLKMAGLENGGVDLVIGCPPCQVFSSLGITKGANRVRYKERKLTEVFVARVLEILPTAVVFENVPGILRRKNRRQVQFLIAKLSKAGYSCVMETLDSARYGVPQFRRRVVVIAIRKAVENSLTMPPQTHVPPEETLYGLKQWVTVRGAIGDLPPLEAGESHSFIANHDAAEHSEKTLEIIQHIPKDGGSRKDLPKRLWLSCHRRLKGRGAESVYGRMRWDMPSSTITTRCHNPSSGRFIHPEQNRAITLREAARLQTIPDDFELHGTKHEMGVWIGNAVPTKLAEVLGRHVLKYIQ